MKKRIISITILFISLFIMSSAKAAKTYTAAGVNSSLENYKAAVSGLESLNCDGTLYNQSTVDKCNTLSLQKSTALTYIYNAREYDDELVGDDAEGVLEANSDECTSMISSQIQEIINKIYLMFYIAGPILVILFGSMDFMSAMLASDEKKRKAAYTKFVRRVIALLLLFASPVLVNVLVNTFGGSKYSANKYTCSYTEKKVTLSYVSRKTSKGAAKNNELADNIIKYAQEIKNVSSSKKWEYTCVGSAAVINYYNNNSYGNMCCADYVSAVLVLAGAFSSEDINGMKAKNTEYCDYWGQNTQATGVHAFLSSYGEELGWERITSESDLLPGDIVFVWPQYNYNPSCIKAHGSPRAGHVEIWAGDGKVYSGGSTGSMRTQGPTSPYRADGHTFIEAYRAPGSSSKKANRR
jgi:hypothetical protein